METIIGITRSELRQAIEDYIAASRVGDTLSYVETARLSTVEAAESSTERLWASLETLARNAPVPTPQFHALPAEPATPEIRQVLCALDRQIAALTKQSDDLARALDYSAEFPAADAEALQQVRRIVIASAGAAELPAEQGEPDEDSPKWLISEQIKGFMDGLGGPEDNRGIQDALQSLGLSTETALAVMWRLAKQFTCAEDLAAGQVVIVNSRGMIEGKRDDADKIVMSDHPVVSYDFGFFQAEQLHGMFNNDTDAKVRVDFMPDGKVFAWDHSPDVAPIELTDTVGGEPESADDFF